MFYRRIIHNGGGKCVILWNTVILGLMACMCSMKIGWARRGCQREKKTFIEITMRPS